MFIESESRDNSKLFHHEKRDAICEGISLVFMFLKIIPAFMEQILFYMNEPD